MKKPPKHIGLFILKRKTGDRYQSRLWNPVIGRVGKTKVWESRDLAEVLMLHFQLKKDYEASGYEIIREIPDQKKERKIEMLLDAAALYEKYLNDDPKLVAKHEARNRDKRYIRDTIYYMRSFLKVLSDQGVVLGRAHVSVLGKEAVGHFYNYLEGRFETGEIGSETWNRYLNSNKYWLRYLVRKGIIQDNPFETVKMKSVVRDPQAMELEELEQLLNVITPENGLSTKGIKRVEKVDYYRPWLSDYILLSTLCGGRPGEMVFLKWSQITGNYIELINYKRNNYENATHNKVYVYIHPELASVLARLMVDQKNENDYILVPDYENRIGLRQFVNKAFRHYWNQVNSKKNLTLNNTRHTYINAVVNTLGEDGFPMHNKKETAVRHYLSKKKRQDLEEGKVLFGVDPSLLSG